MKYRNSPELLNDKLCLTDGGLETVLVFEHGIDLPAFASYTLFNHEGGERIFRDYLQPYIDLAITHQMAFQLVDNGWRANRDWGITLGLSENQLEQIIRTSIDRLVSIQSESETDTSPMPIVGCIGPRGDGYVPGNQMTAEEATEYHNAQIATLADTRADSATAMTLSYSAEGIGIINAAKQNNLPVTISFTVETNGRLPSGETLQEAIESCDQESGRYAKGFMINCAHPSHFKDQIAEEGEWVHRIEGVRANASKLSHAELDESTELDRGHPDEFAIDVQELKSHLPSLRTIGGCCGTDIEHITKLASAFRS